MGKGHVGGDAVVEGLTAPDGNGTIENYDDARSVNIRRCLKCVSGHHYDHFTISSKRDSP